MKSTLAMWRIAAARNRPDTLREAPWACVGGFMLIGLRASRDYG